MMTRLQLLFQFLLVTLVLSATQSDERHSRSNLSPRVLRTFDLDGGLGTFHLLDSDPREQVTLFCDMHSLSAEYCDSLSAEAETQFFLHQWKLESFSLDVIRPDGSSTAVTFDLYTGLGPVLQVQRFCLSHDLPPSACEPMTEETKGLFYSTGRLLLSTQLELSSTQDSGHSHSRTVPFQVFDNLTPVAQARDFCLQHDLPALICSEVIFMAEDAFYPALVSLPFSLYGDDIAADLQLYEREDPVLAALTACSQTLGLPPSSPECSALMEAAEAAFFSSILPSHPQRQRHKLIDFYSIPGMSVGCHLYNDLDPRWQALRCCDRNRMDEFSCESVVHAVSELFEKEVGSPVASFSLLLPATASEKDSSPIREVELQLYAALDPFSQVMAFCQQHHILLRHCLEYVPAAEAAFYEFRGEFLLDITLGDPVQATLSLYTGTDPVLQAKRFCDRQHMVKRHCDVLQTRAFEEFAATGNVLDIFKVGQEAELVLYDHMDPRWQVVFFCEQQEHVLSHDTCFQLLAMAEKVYYGSGALIEVISVETQNSTVALELHQHVPPGRQVGTFCDRYFILEAECETLREVAKKLFTQAGEVIGSVALSVSRGGEVVQEVVECLDNLDPEVQAREWCTDIGFPPLSPFCSSLIDTFETAYFSPGDVIAETDFAGHSFVLRDYVEPFVQASRFCRRHHVSLPRCQPLVQFSEQLYYKFGEELRVFTVSSVDVDSNIELSFSLFDRADPADQVDRFCARHRVPTVTCEELRREAVLRFHQAGTIIDTLTVDISNSSSSDSITLRNASFKFSVYSNLDPEIQARRKCVEYELAAGDCNSLIALAEQVFFRSREIITTFTYMPDHPRSQNSDAHPSSGSESKGDDDAIKTHGEIFTLLNRVDPYLQLSRFFRRHGISSSSRLGLTATILEAFQSAGTVLFSLTVEVTRLSTPIDEGRGDDAETAPIAFVIYDNLDPALQARHFCSTHSLSSSTCEEITSAAEKKYFNVTDSEVVRFTLGIGDAQEPHVMEYYDSELSGMGVEQQENRFCLLRDMSVASCAAALKLLEGTEERRVAITTAA